MSFKSDIEIAREANKLPISEVAKKLNISFKDIVPYGHDKAKISESFIKEIPQNKKGKLINSEILQSSGYADLDNEAGDAVYQAAPFGPFPSAWTLNKLNVNITFNYSPQGWYY